MLSAIRDRSRGVFSWLIVGLLSVPFALWGINSYFGTGAAPPIAEVNGREINQSEFTQRFQQQYQRLQSLYGERFSPDLVDEASLRRQVLEDLVSEHLLIDYADQHGLIVSDAALAQAISAIDAFQNDGQFDPARYTQLLGARGYSPAGFEYELRQAERTDQLRGVVLHAPVVTDAAIDRFLSLAGQRRDVLVATVRIPPAAVPTPTAAELTAFYEANRDAFATAPRVRLRYLLASAEQLASEIQIPDEEIAARYEADADSYQSPERRRVQHVLLTGDDAAVRLAAMREQIVSEQRSFAEMATESEDTASAESGGELGWLTRDDLDPALTEAAFALPVGELSEPVKSPYGWHLLRVAEAEPAERQPLSAVAENIREALRAQQLEERRYELGESLEQLAFEYPDSLDSAAEAARLPLATTDWLSAEPQAQAPDLPEAVLAQMRRLAFTPALLEDGGNSPLIELEDGSLLLFRVTAHEPAQPQPLAEVQAEVAAQLQAERRASLLAEAADAVETAWQAGKDPASLSLPNVETTLQRYPGLRRAADGEQTLAPAIRQTAFRMQVGDYRQVTLDTGVRAVVHVSDVNTSPPSEADDEEQLAARREAIRAQLEAARGQSQLLAFVGALREDADVRLQAIEPDRQ